MFFLSFLGVRHLYQISQHGKAGLHGLESPCSSKRKVEGDDLARCIRESEDSFMFVCVFMFVLCIVIVPKGMHI